MSATDELRRLLDERGVEWKDYGYENHTWWGGWHAENRPSVNGLFVKVEGVVTPEQAIAATLGNDGVGRTNDGVDGRGTCHMERADWDDGTCTWGCICSACGKKFEHETGRGWHYCPKCGAEVVE